MIQFPIIPINEYESIIEETWTPSTWPALRKLLNPKADAFIDRCVLLRFNLQRAIHIRSASVRKYFWSGLSILDEARIEAEADALAEMYEQVRLIERTYIIDTYLDEDLESLSARKAPFFRAEIDLGAIPPPYDTYAPYEFDGMSHMLPPGHPIRLDYNHAMANQSVPMSRIKPPSFKWLRLHLDHIGPLHHRIVQSHQHLLYEFWQAGLDSNSLSGAGAKLRALFVNENVPIPNDYTFLTWWNHAGIDFSEIVNADLRALWAKMCGFEPTHIMSYVLPCMPMSREHRSGHQLLGDDSHADHSLSWKSSAHSRLSHGRIIHGLWECTTVLLADGRDDSGSPRVYVVANERVKTGTATLFGLSQRHRAMLPILRRWDSAHSYRDMFLHQPHAYQRQLHGVVNDPYLTYRQPLSFHKSEPGLSFDVGFRSLAKFHRVHFRFDEDEVGTLAATEWRAAFVDCAIRYARRSNADHQRLQFESSLIRQAAIRPASSKAKTRFDLSMFDSE